MPQLARLFRSFRTMRSSLLLREGARPEVVRDSLGHADRVPQQELYCARHGGM